MKNFYTLFFIILLILIAISIGYYYTIYKTGQDIVPEEPQLTEDPLQILDQQLIDIEIKKNFFKNKIKLADQDHYNIFIDFSDSIITLETNGVTAHSAPILNHEVAGSFEILKQNKNIIRLLKDPLQLIDEWASVPKNPIRVKDISGFEWNPDSLNFVPTIIDTEYVFIVLKCSRDFTVMMSQRAILGKMPEYIISDHLSKFKNLIETKNNSEELPFSHLLQNHWIGIEIPRSDAIALYRAFNENSLIVLCL